MRSFASQQESLARRASFLRLTSRTVSESIRAGSFRSLVRGQGIEFNGVRDYVRGDDIRAIDWNVSARMGRPYVKLFEAERELTMCVVLDASFSMRSGTGARTKYAVAAEAVALLAFAAEHNGCPFGAVFFDAAVRFSGEPKVGTKHTMVVLKKLDECATGGGRGSVLPNALTGSGSLLRTRALVFIFSDFRSVGWEAPLARLSQVHDCVAVRVTTPADEAIPPVGTLPVVDSETDVRTVFPTLSTAFRREWKTAADSRAARWYAVCRRRGVTPLSLSTTDDPAAVLASFFAQKRRTV
ncbi:MAG: DUF58 domain-containing protein [Treponema sp.]|nr:DUF58 domain-containing protein [Treponema sp.]